MTSNLGVRCAISVGRVLSANPAKSAGQAALPVVGEKRLSRLAPPRPAAPFAATRADGDFAMGIQTDSSVIG